MIPWIITGIIGAYFTLCTANKKSHDIHLPEIILVTAYSILLGPFTFALTMYSFEQKYWSMKP